MVRKCTPILTILTVTTRHVLSLSLRRIELTIPGDVILSFTLFNK